MYLSFHGLNTYCFFYKIDDSSDHIPREMLLPSQCVLATIFLICSFNVLGKSKEITN